MSHTRDRGWQPRGPRFVGGVEPIRQHVRYRHGRPSSLDGIPCRCRAGPRRRGSRQLLARDRSDRSRDPGSVSRRDRSHRQRGGGSASGHRRRQQHGRATRVAPGAPPDGRRGTQGRKTSRRRGSSRSGVLVKTLRGAHSRGFAVCPPRDAAARGHKAVVAAQTPDGTPDAGCRSEREDRTRVSRSSWRLDEPVGTTCRTGEVASAAAEAQASSTFLSATVVSSLRL